jgi:hypothetical protein
VSAARETTTGDDVVGGLLSCTPAREANYVSGVQQLLGEHVDAVASADEALRLSRAQPVRSYATEAQIHLNRVSAFLDLGDVEAATTGLRPVVDLPPNRRLSTLTGRVAQLGEVVASASYRQSRAARDLHEQMVGFADEPISRAT